MVLTLNEPSLSGCCLRSGTLERHAKRDAAKSVKSTRIRYLRGPALGHAAAGVIRLAR